MNNIKCYYVLGGLKTQKKDWKENMREGIIKRNSISECDKW